MIARPWIANAVKNAPSSAIPSTPTKLDGNNPAMTIAATSTRPIPRGIRSPAMSGHGRGSRFDNETMLAAV